MAKKEPLLKSRDVAYILDMSPDEVVALACEGKLKGLRLGHFWKFRRAAVEAYKKQLTAK